MDKLTRICAVVGGIWGLISGIIIFYYLFLWSVAGGGIWEFFFEDMLFWKIILLPAYLTHQLIFIPLLELGSSILSIRIFLLILLLVAIIVSILFGIGISLLAANLINKGKNVIKK